MNYIRLFFWINEGMLLENMVAQNLRANGRRAYYYKETSKETKKTVMEIDFLIRDSNKLVPIEVKSGEKKSIKSLISFKEKYGKKVGRGIILHHGELRVEENLLWLPYYMASVL